MQIFKMRKPITPGEILQKEFLDPYKISRQKLAGHLGWNVKRIDRICNNQSSITPEKALMLGAAFGMSAEFWLNAQNATDLWVARQNFKAVKLLACVKIPEPIEIEKIEIEKNIPLPLINPRGRGGPPPKRNYPFKNMEIGDSFLIKCKNTPKKRNSTRALIYHHYVAFNKKNKNKIKISCRTVLDGFRIWRVE